MTLTALDIQRQAAIVSATTVVTSVANYGFSLLVIRLLAAPDYVQYASVQSLLLVLGSGGMAAVPWAVARHVALDSSHRAAGEALGFGLLASLVQGIVFAGLAFALVTPVAGLGLGATTAAAAFAMSLVAAPLGLLQGQQRLLEISALRIVEAVVRLGLSLLLLVSFAADPRSPVTGFAVGSAVLFALGLAVCQRSLPLRRASPRALRELLGRSLQLGAVQLCLASLGVVDTIVITFAGLLDGPASAYQIAALLGRVPLFLASAIALTYFQGLARAETDADVRDQLAPAMRLLLVLAVPIAVLVATCPPAVLGPLTGGRLDDVARLLPATAFIGVAVAAVTALSTLYQAREQYRRFFVVLLPIVLAQPAALVLAGRLGGVAAYAIAGAIVGSVALVVVNADLRRWRPWSGLRRSDVAGFVAVCALAALSLAQPWAWAAAMAAAAITCAPLLGLGSRRR